MTMPLVSPRRLNFACGATRWPGFENSDVNREDGTVYLDLEQRPYPYADNSVEIIMLSHALQMTHDGTRPVHPDALPIMREFHRILVLGGWLRIDENPWRIYVEGENVSEDDRLHEMSRGFPDELRVPRTDFVDMLYAAGFTTVLSVPPDTTSIACDDETRAALVGNHLDHASFTVEAQK